MHAVRSEEQNSSRQRPLMGKVLRPVHDSVWDMALEAVKLDSWGPLRGCWVAYVFPFVVSAPVKVPFIATSFLHSPRGYSTA